MKLLRKQSILKVHTTNYFITHEPTDFVREKLTMMWIRPQRYYIRQEGSDISINLTNLFAGITQNAQSCTNKTSN